MTKLPLHLFIDGLQVLFALKSILFVLNDFLKLRAGPVELEALVKQLLMVRFVVLEHRVEKAPRGLQLFPLLLLLGRGSRHAFHVR